MQKKKKKKNETYFIQSSKDSCNSSDKGIFTEKGIIQYQSKLDLHAIVGDLTLLLQTNVRIF
jgi:hypothetical protein